MANPGSVGLARDTSGLACDAIYEAGRLTLKRIPYDVRGKDKNGKTRDVKVSPTGDILEVDWAGVVSATDSVQVLKGISPGDTVITTGGYGLPEGCPVKIVPDLAKAKSTE